MTNVREIVIDVLMVNAFAETQMMFVQKLHPFALEMEKLQSVFVTVDLVENATRFALRMELVR